MKRKNTFKMALLIYVAVWVVAITGVCVKLWSVISEYQVNYVLASENANPDLLMEEVLVDYDSDHIMNIAAPFLPDTSEYERADVIDSIVKDLVNEKNLSFRREARFTERKPIYEVLADGKVIGLVSLKQGTESDTYGFRKCVVDEETLNLDLINLHNYQISVPKGYSVYVNEKELDEKYLVDEKKLDSAMAKKAGEITGKEYSIATYDLIGFLQKPDVNISAQGKEISLFPDENNCYSCELLSDDAFLEQMKEYILAAGKSYVMNANQMESFEEVAKYLRANSNAFANVKSVQSGLTWAGKPDKLDIVEARISDFVRYNEDVFTVRTYYRINRLYREVTYDEEMSYEWLFTKQNDKWLIEDFSLVKN